MAGAAQVEANLQEQLGNFICTLDKKGLSPICEGLDSNFYSHMSHQNGCSPLWEGLDSNH